MNLTDFFIYLFHPFGITSFFQDVNWKLGIENVKQIRINLSIGLILDWIRIFAFFALVGALIYKYVL